MQRPSEFLKWVFPSFFYPTTYLNLCALPVQVDPLIEATQRMLQAHHQLSNHREALKDLKQTYRPTGDPTDFQAEIDERVSRLAQANP